MHNYNHLEASDGFASVAYLIEIRCRTCQYVTQGRYEYFSSQFSCRFFKCDQCRNSGCISRVHNFGVALVRHENKQAAEEDKDIFEGRLHLPATDVGNLSQFNIETNEVIEFFKVRIVDFTYCW